ncbi:helix-turn-helix domain-containing protein [Pararhodonellum marinum]|uniref:helix-turn-helix domain-containing protein n=1 Tax=Pararhodonellum marinum TaxID=2755358 RepID=UPI00188DE637|nr:AraC family transcriptional regulator [Pararhodonellum marinum]
MSQAQFKFQQGVSEVLDLFPQILEFGLVKNKSIQLGSFVPEKANELQIYFVSEGKFEWTINHHQHVLFPEDVAVVLPGQEIGGVKGFLGIGAFYCLKLEVELISWENILRMGKWSSLTKMECRDLSEILLLNAHSVLKGNNFGLIFQDLYHEIETREFGFQTRVNALIDSLLINIGRQSTRQAASKRNFPKAITKLEKTLRKNLDHQWTVVEMAAMVGLGTSAFTEKVKNQTGFAPLHFLIDIRISEAKKLLGREEVSITEVALDTGFYSSQHFSTTFKKLTGHTPGEYRRKVNSKKKCY